MGWGQFQAFFPIDSIYARTLTNQDHYLLLWSLWLFLFSNQLATSRGTVMTQHLPHPTLIRMLLLLLLVVMLYGQHLTVFLLSSLRQLSISTQLLNIDQPQKVTQLILGKEGVWRDQLQRIMSQIHTIQGQESVSLGRSLQHPRLSTQYQHLPL